MAFDAVAYRNQLQLEDACITKPSFFHSVGWSKEGSGHVLVTKSTGETVVPIMIGKVSEHRLQCDPTGNFRIESNFSNDFSKTKFSFSAGILDEPALKPTFLNAVSTLNKLQKSLSTTNDNRNLIDDEGDMSSIRFSAKMFEKRVSAFYNP
jgi:hypothetical protein